MQVKLFAAEPPKTENDVQREINDWLATHPGIDLETITVTTVERNDVLSIVCLVLYEEPVGINN